MRAFEWDARDSAGVIVNMPVWKSVEALAALTYAGAHREVLRRPEEDLRADWKAPEPGRPDWLCPA